MENKTLPVVGTGDSGSFARAGVAVVIGFAAGRGWLPADFATANPEIVAGLGAMVVFGWSAVAKRFGL